MYVGGTLLVIIVVVNYRYQMHQILVCPGYSANLKARYRISGDVGYRISGRIFSSKFDCYEKYEINKNRCKICFL
jgi:hypothetical protein